MSETGDTVSAPTPEHAETLPAGAGGAEPGFGGQIGRYLVLNVLGRGGMGVVFEAYDPVLDRRIAVKRLRDRAASGDASAAPSDGRVRLRREAQALARLAHPNVIAVHDVGEAEGRVFLAMQFVEGSTLHDLLQTRGPVGAQVSAPSWMTEHSVQCRLAARFAVGRVFLAGDAAHTHSPVTGHGMNAGMQDAFNLAWKLALVHKGLGRPVLLDSYEAERMPVARQLLQTTDSVTRGLQSFLSLHGSLGQLLRNHLLHFVSELGIVQQRISRNLTMLDVSYCTSPVVGEQFTARAVHGHDNIGGMKEDVLHGRSLSKHPLRCFNGTVRQKGAQGLGGRERITFAGRFVKTRRSAVCPSFRS